MPESGATPAMSRSNRAGRLTLLWAAAVWAVLFIGVDAPWLRRLELQAFDMLFILRGPRPDDAKDIVIVEIDDRTFLAGDLEQFPFPRREYARAIDHLAAAGADLIVSDFLFVDSSGSEADDLALERSIAAAGNVFLAATTLDHQPGAPPGWLAHALSYAPDGGPPLARGVQLPLERYRAAARGIGLVNVRPDLDHSVRRMPLVQVCDGRLLPSLSLAVAMHRLGVARDQVDLVWRQHLRYGSQRVPVDGFGSLTLDFLGPWPASPVAAVAAATPFRRFSFIDIWRGDLDRADFAGKIVLIGWTATGAMDFYPTPFAGRTPGIELHATALENLLTGHTARTAARPMNNLMLLLMTILPALLLSRLRALWACIAATVFAVGYFDLVFHTFLTRGVLLDLVAPLLALAVVFVGSAAFRLAREEQTSGILSRAFEFYVSPEVLRKLADAGEGVLSLEHAERREVTVLFADIVGFTELSERIDPGEVMKLLNEYLTDLSEILLRYDAYIDKYLGDGLMAVFNAFAAVGYPDHALRAVRAALEMQDKTRRLRTAAEKRGEAAFGLGIGINTGPVVAGNLGSLTHAQYSVIGDTVNVASRIEEQCRTFDTDILIGQPTHEQCSYYLVTGRSWPVQLKGVSETMNLYEVIGLQHIDELVVH